MTKTPPDLDTETLNETDNFILWRVVEPDGETTYHLELNNITLHFFNEEWQEFIELLKPFLKKT